MTFSYVKGRFGERDSAVQVNIYTSISCFRGQNHNMLDYKSLVLLPQVSRSTAVTNLKTNHLNRPGNVIKPPLRTCSDDVKKTNGGEG